MIVICEDCGKKYRIDPARIKGKAASFKCRICAHQIFVKREKSLTAESAVDQSAITQQINAEAITVAMDFDSGATVAETPRLEKAIAAAATGPGRRAGRFGLRVKMLILFFLIPMILLTGTSLLSFRQFDSAAQMLTQRGADIVNQMAEEKVADIAAAVAMQCKLYLLSHPELKNEEFNGDLGFKSLAVQKVGATGYTALYQRPGADGVWRTWAHINPKIIGIDMSMMRMTLKDSFAGFWKIFIGVKNGRISRGYYTWQDKDLQFRDKFMVCAPIAGTRYVIAATAYLDELTGPTRLMEAGARDYTDKAKMLTLVTLAASFLVIGLIALIYGQRLSVKIRSLTETAEFIGAKQPGRDIKKRSGDEIGDLEDAVTRLRDGNRPTFDH